MRTGQPRNSAHLWVLNPIAASDLTLRRTCLALLSDAEKRQSEKFVFETDRLAHLTVHALLRICLSKHAPTAPDEWIFAEDNHGRPLIEERLNPNDLRFSISHSRKLVACMVTRGADCGVDVERIGRTSNVIDLATRFFSIQETAHLASLEHEQQASGFTALWTLKEAYTKAKGLGLSLPLNTFGFELPSAPFDKIVFHAPDEDDPDLWSFHLERVDPNHWLSAAARHPLGLDCSFQVQKVGSISSMFSGHAPV